MSLLVTAGQAGDAPQFPAVMDAIAVPRRGPGRSRQRPRRVLADKAYSSRAIRDWLRRRGIAATIPQPADQQAHRRRLGSKGGRPPAFDKQTYRQRNAERCINRLKQWRGLAMRTDKLAVHYQAALTLAGILLWTRP
jgi:transposase